MNFSEEFLQALSSARHVAVLTGAGISAESGVATFRDQDGLWQKFNPAELASMEGFMSNPALVWEWYQHRRGIIGGVEPNEGHKALAAMEQQFEKFTLITQNVDRLHQRAGSSAALELHGNLVENYCMDCRAVYHFADEKAELRENPRCRDCSGLVRPAVVWFGEMLPVETLRAAQIAAQDCQVFLSIGTSAEVMPAAELPMIARENFAYVVEINPQPTVISGRVHSVIREPAGIALPRLLRELDQFRKSRV